MKGYRFAIVIVLMCTLSGCLTYQEMRAAEGPSPMAAVGAPTMTPLTGMNS